MAETFWASFLAPCITSLLLHLRLFSAEKGAIVSQQISRTDLNPAANNDVTAARVTSEVLHSTWLFNRPVSDTFTRSIVMARERTGASVRVYCGTVKCLENIRSLNKPRITATFLVVPNVLGKTLLKEWGERHALFKILTGLHYEWFLTKALCLAHLWLYGGRFYLPPYQMSEDEKTWPCLSLDDIPSTEMSSKSVPLLPGDKLVKVMMEQFLRSMDSWDSKTKPDAFRDTVWNAFSRHCHNGTHYCLIQNTESFRDFYARKGSTFHDDPHFGVLTLDLNLGPTNRGNIGDQIQGIASVQFLPFVDFFMDRDYQVAPDTRGKHVVFFNAWWGTRRVRWPPAKNIDPVMVSIHAHTIMQWVISSSAKIVDFLKSKEPIGARDMVTKNFMEKRGVRSFFSGCMTLFLQIRNPRPIEERNNTIYITDLSEENMELLPKHIREKGELVKHDITYGKQPTLMTQEWFVDAYKFLEKYSRAKVVITQRIHAALPCVAMGTPVIFISAHKMPGGGATKAKATDRVAGLIDLFHAVDLFSLTVEQAKQKLKKFNWENPPRNPNLAIRMQKVSSTWFILRKKQAVYESARRYGMFPLTPAWLTKVQPMRIFHIIHDDANYRSLTWHQWRCIESILFHHPTSQLFFHSNTIEQAAFNVLTEVGYGVTSVKYSISELFGEIQSELQLGEFDEASRENLLRDYGALKMLLLYKYGGIYLSENTIALKEIDVAQSNVLSLDSESNVNPWMLNFEKNHKFLRDAIEMFPSMYVSMKSDEGKALLTKLWNSWESNAGSKYTINIAKKNSFYDLTDTSQRQSKIIHEEVSVIRIPDVGKCLENGYKIDDLSPKLVEGTVCKQIFNDHCLFCSNQY